MNFYVYILLDPRKPGVFTYGENLSFDLEPYYVGKGKSKRIEKHFFNYHRKYDRNRHKTNKINKIIRCGFKPRAYVVKVAENLNENEALNLEIDIINLIGRNIDKMGPLTNLTRGGDGVSGIPNKNKGKSWESIIGTKKANKYRKQMSLARRGKNNPMFGKKNLSGKPVKQLDLNNRLIHIWKSIRHASEGLGIRYGCISKCLAPQDKSKQTHGFKWEYVDKSNVKNLENDKRFHTYEVTFPDGHKEIIKNLSEASRRHKLSNSFLCALAKGRSKSKNWKCKKI